ncbi:uncharacterized protein VTP21DRAFT_10637 [Calcarisporiella thermophila]|uniref:uncharacterized protein n=1 Tax=Calcarisporiella thermophila TaxID=911321 RepID=UPI003743F758
MNTEQLNHFIWPSPESFLSSQTTITPISSPGSELLEADNLNDSNEELWDDEDLDATVIPDEEYTPDPSRTETWSSRVLSSTSGTLDPGTRSISEGYEVMQVQSFMNIPGWTGREDYWIGKEDCWTGELWQKVVSKVALSIGVPVYAQHPRECSWCACQGAIVLGCGIVIV